MASNLTLNRNTLLTIAMGVLIVSGLIVATVLYPLTLGQPLPVVADAPDFTLTNQDGETVSLTDFEGKAVLINFMYTSCEDAEFCPLMTAHMKSIGNDLGDHFGEEVVFLSVTIDPETDSPAVMRNYGELHGIDFTQWQFLTSDRATMDEVYSDYGVVAFTAHDIGMTMPVTDNTTMDMDNMTMANDDGDHVDADGNPIIHNWVIKLIDQDGQIRREYTKTNWVLEVTKNDILSLL